MIFARCTRRAALALVALSLYGFFGPAALGFDTGKLPAKTSVPPPPKAVVAPTAVAAPFRFPEHELRSTRFRLNTILGVTVLHRAALGVGAQLGYAPFPSVPFFVGPELHYSQFASGAFIPDSLVNTLATAWIEIPLSTPPRLSLSLGVLAGIGFASGLVGVSPVNFSAFCDVAIVQDIDDLMSLRWQVRPGIVDKQFAILGDFSLAFRFY